MFHFRCAEEHTGLGESGRVARGYGVPIYCKAAGTADPTKSGQPSSIWSYTNEIQSPRLLVLF